jgi:micrococcal nuclease
MERWVPPAVIACIAAGSVWLAAPAGGPPRVATVARVVDGDTIVIRAPAGGEDTVRLLGIDTPETVDPDEPVGCFGPEASAYAKHLLAGRVVVLVYDRERRDMYGRLLAYAYLGGGRPLFVNRRLVALGYARTLVFPPNVAHRAELARAEAAAALAGRGLWDACPP